MSGENSIRRSAKGCQRRDVKGLDAKMWARAVLDGTGRFPVASFQRTWIFSLAEGITYLVTSTYFLLVVEGSTSKE